MYTGIDSSGSCQKKREEWVYPDAAPFQCRMDCAVENYSGKLYIAEIDTGFRCYPDDNQSHDGPKNHADHGKPECLQDYHDADRTRSRTDRFHHAENDAGDHDAWESTGRVSHLDLDNEGINGGELDTLTPGLTWYLNPNTRTMCNYIYADPTGLNSGDAHILQTRFQMAF